MKKKTITTTGNFTPARFALLCLAIFCSLAFLLGRVAWLQIIKPAAAEQACHHDDNDYFHV
ncbi:hypothetical protein FCI58_22260 [Enterobacter hormaechei]|nr:hypothetical protein [Enterobacter hormaechei]